MQSSRTSAGLKSRLINALCLAAPLSLGLLFGTPAWSVPSIQSVSVSPNPLLAGENFTVAVTASADVTQAVATVDFRPGNINALEIPLSNQGSLWTGSAVAPSALKHPDKAEAKITVLLFDAKGHREKKDLHVDVVVPTITAVFSNGVVTVTGDNHDNTLIVSRDVAGNILVNGGTVAVTGGAPTVNNTTLIRILGLGGNDVLTVDDANGRMPSANLFGGDGDDILTGSVSDDVLDGGPGNDSLFGRDGNDTLIGGPGNDILVGGRGTDVMQGGDGDDQIVWSPGDGSDVVEGDAGNDTLVFNGANINETIDLSANGPRLRFFRNVANITMDCDGVERVIFHALSGVDTVTVNDLTGTQVTNVLVDLASATKTGDSNA
ncbi:MAG: Alkaline phosphatase, partial [Verrucomicrobiales bacterium]|nr:Alkaline phosphatase [Verrucomicrobiales bacterium]